MYRCQRGPGEPQRADDVRVEDLRDRAQVGVHQRSEHGVDRGVVDDDVAAAERLEHRRTAVSATSGSPTEPATVTTSAPKRRERGLGLLELGGLAGDHADVGPRRRARFGDRAADARGWPR